MQRFAESSNNDEFGDKYSIKKYLNKRGLDIFPPPVLTDDISKCIAPAIILLFIVTINQTSFVSKVFVKCLIEGLLCNMKSHLESVKTMNFIGYNYSMFNTYLE